MKKAITRWSVIVPTAGRARFLEVALVSLCQQTLPPERYEILVVNNGEDDRATDDIVIKIMERYPCARVRLLHASPPGLLSGRHCGASVAEAPILTFVDDDIRVEPDYAASILAAFACGSPVFVTGPCLPDYEVAPPAWLSAFWREANGEKRFPFLSLMDLGPSLKRISPVSVWGLNFSVRKETLFALKGFHPDNVPEKFQIFQGDGESGLTQKAAQRKCEAVYSPSVKVWHRVTAERMTETYLKKRQFYQGVSDSYARIREMGQCSLDMPHFVETTADLLVDMPKRLHNAYVEGWRFHQDAVAQNPRLLQWVCKEDYWDYQYPTL